MIFRRIQIFLISVAGILLQPSYGSLDSLEWLIGNWTAETPSATIDENWTKYSDSTFEGLGHTRSKRDPEKESFEYLRIFSTDTEIFYVAKVDQNRLPVSFALVEQSSEYLRFENQEHDFPQQIEYRRLEDGQLQVRVSSSDSKGFTLTFRQVD